MKEEKDQKLERFLCAILVAIDEKHIGDQSAAELRVRMTAIAVMIEGMLKAVKKTEQPESSPS